MEIFQDENDDMIWMFDGSYIWLICVLSGRIHSCLFHIVLIVRIIDMEESIFISDKHIKTCIFFLLHGSSFLETMETQTQIWMYKHFFKRDLNRIPETVSSAILHVTISQKSSLQIHSYNFWLKAVLNKDDVSTFECTIVHIIMHARLRYAFISDPMERLIDLKY